MKILLKGVGAAWALIGVGNIFMSTASKEMMGWVTIFNVVVFIFPGLVLFGIGMLVGNKGKLAPASGIQVESGNIPPIINNDSDLKKCPFCAEMIKKEAIKCRFCNSKF